MRHSILATIMLVALTFSAEAYDFKSGDLYYNITSNSEPYTVEVTYQYYWSSDNYSGETTITIPETVTSGEQTYSVTSIGNYAFEDCSGLTSVIIPNSVTSIGSSAFELCRGLTSVTIPNSVTSIGWRAFCGCSSLTSVTIPNSVTSIGNEAFYYCSGLTSVTIPNSVTSIGEDAFYYCSGLTSLTIPNSVTSIGEDAFSDCYNLNYNEYDNALYLGNSDNPYLCQIKAKSTHIASCEINPNCRFIYSGAFRGCSGLTSVNIPNSVTSIGEDAFYYCSGLTSLTIPNSVTSIGDYAFEGCTSSVLYCQATGKPSGWANNWNYNGGFAVWDCKAVSLSANDNTFGAVTGGKDGLFEPNESITISAISAKHYHFVKWSDGDTENPRTIKVTTDTTFTAVFAIDTLKVNTFAENGTVSGTGAYTYGTQTSLTATPAEHYHFAKWNDGNTENPRSIKVTSDTTLIAVFAIDTLKVTASAENGTVFGAGVYTYGTSILFGAIPAEHYHFAKWSDGNTENPRSITVTEDITLIAIFEKADAIDTLKVTASAENGTVFGAGEYTYGISILLVATPAEHYHFAKWNDGNTENPRTITLTTDTTLIAVFAIDTLKVTAFAENGTVSGAGEFAYGATTSLTATPAENYHFVKWSDGNTENPRSITVTEDITLIAIFEKADAISTDAVADVKIYAHHNVIVVENATDDIYVYDAMGRLIARNSDSNRNAVHHVSTEITMQNTGIYIVKVGNEAKRVYLGF